MGTTSAPEAVAFIVASCDRYSDLWEPFFHCFRKFWPDCPYPVYLLTNHKGYESRSVTVLKVGDDRSYADNLAAAISQIEERWVILWLEDVLLSKTIDTARLQRIVAQAQSIPVGYLKLSTDLPLSYADGFGEIGPVPKGVKYRSAVGLSLYHVPTLKKLLTPGASAWDMDRSELSNELEEPFFTLTSKAARKPLLPYVNAVNKGRWNLDAIPFLKREGFTDLIKERKRLSLGSHLYRRAYEMRSLAFRLMKKYWY